MNIVLTPDLEALINEKIQSGLYHSPSEVIRDGLLLLKEKDDLKRLRLEELRKDVMIGVERIQQGKYRTYNSGKELAEEIIKEGLEELNNNKKAKLPNADNIRTSKDRY